MTALLQRENLSCQQAVVPLILGYQSITLLGVPTIITPDRGASTITICTLTHNQSAPLHYSESYSYENNVSEVAFNVIQPLPNLSKVDGESMVDELIRKTIGDLAPGKALGKNGITPEVIKHAKCLLVKDLYQLLCLCWKEGLVPQDKQTRIQILAARVYPESQCSFKAE